MPASTAVCSSYSLVITNGSAARAASAGSHSCRFSRRGTNSWSATELHGPQRLAQEPLRPEHKDEDHHEEGDHVAVARGDELDGEVLHHADDEAAEDGAGNAREPPEDAGGEPLEPGGAAHAGVHG